MRKMIRIMWHVIENGHFDRWHSEDVEIGEGEVPAFKASSLAKGISLDEGETLEYQNSVPIMDVEWFKKNIPDFLDVGFTLSDSGDSVRFCLAYDEEVVPMRNMLRLGHWCVENGLEFELCADYDATDRCGYLAYDSVVTPMIYVDITVDSSANHWSGKVK